MKYTHFNVYFNIFGKYVPFFLVKTEFLVFWKFCFLMILHFRISCILIYVYYMYNMYIVYVLYNHIRFLQKHFSKIKKLLLSIFFPQLTSYRTWAVTSNLFYISQSNISSTSIFLSIVKLFFSTSSFYLVWRST